MHTTWSTQNDLLPLLITTPHTIINYNILPLNNHKPDSWINYVELHTSQSRVHMLMHLSLLVCSKCTYWAKRGIHALTTTKTTWCVSLKYTYAYYDVHSCWVRLSTMATAVVHQYRMIPYKHVMLIQYTVIHMHACCDASYKITHAAWIRQCWQPMVCINTARSNAVVLIVWRHAAPKLSSSAASITLSMPSTKLLTSQHVSDFHTVMLLN